MSFGVTHLVGFGAGADSSGLYGNGFQNRSLVEGLFGGTIMENNNEKL